MQLTGKAFTGELQENDIRISMDLPAPSKARQAGGKTLAELYFGTMVVLKAT